MLPLTSSCCPVLADHDSVLPYNLAIEELYGNCIIISSAADEQRYFCMKIGMYYWPQGFGAAQWSEADDKQNWTFSDNGIDRHAFRCREIVKSCCWRPGPDVCYCTDHVETVRRHAEILSGLKVNFLIYDNTNASKFMLPHVNIPWVGSLKIFTNLRSVEQGKIKSVFMLSLTNSDNGTERYIGDPAYADRMEFTKAHIQELADIVERFPADFLYVNDKPLLLFYISQGSNVKLANGQPAFHGRDNITPTIADFDLRIQAGGRLVTIREVFTIRYTVQCAAWDFPYDNDVWPWTCDYGLGNFREAGYASLVRIAGDPTDESRTAPGIRSNYLFDFLVDKAVERGCQYLVIKGWNEFSISGDEGDGSSTASGYFKAHTIEPCTVQAPGGDPFFFLDRIRAKLNSLTHV